MKTNYTYLPFNKFIYRTPMYSTEFGRTTIYSNAKLWQHIAKAPLTLEAIYLSSISLYNDILKQPQQKDKERLLLSTARYFSRMFMRSTPFGLFAGCSIGRWGHKNKIILSNSIKRITRMDMVYLYEVSQYISNLDEVRNILLFYPNNTIYKYNDNYYRYIEFYYQNGIRRHRISQFEDDEAIDYILKLSQNGITREDLRNRKLCNDINQSDWNDYIEEILKEQILISDLTPTVTGGDFFKKIVSVIENTKSDNNSVVKNLKAISELLNQFGDNSELNISLYNDITRLAENINIHFDPKCLFQVDYIRQSQIAELDKGLCGELQEGIELLINLSCKENIDDLNNFRKKFLERYEMQSVSLLEALDPEIGIGYPINQQYYTGHNIIDNLKLPQSSQIEEYTSLKINTLQKTLLKKILQCNSRLMEIALEDNDIDKSGKKRDNLPKTLSAMVSLINTFNNGVYIILQAIGGSCAANMMSRFAYLDNEIDELVQEITTKESELYGKNYIVAEIAHSPEARVGNILQRPYMREYEIPYLVATAPEKVNTILLSDLMIKIRNSEIYLFSKKTNKPVLPKLTSAHNFKNNSTPIYRFLCDMQFLNENRNLSFSWGELGKILDFFPRVRYKNIILSLTRWKISINDLNPFIDINNKSVNFNKLSVWRKRKNIDDYSFLVDGDNKLYIDWNNSLSVLSFFKIVCKRNTVIIEEFLSDSNRPIITDGSNGYRNEFIVPFYKTE